MSIQEQMRRGTTAENDAFTGALGETTYDTQTNRQRNHDGSLAGGFEVPIAHDLVRGDFDYGVASGTDTIAVSIAGFPSTYSSGQRFRIKAANTTTGACTINVNTIGALTLKKKDFATVSIAAAGAGDIIGGGFYDVTVIDGSNALLESVDSGGIQSVSQGDLNTSTGVITHTVNAFQRFTLPGGQYGFYPNAYADSTSSGFGATINAETATTSTSIVSSICLKASIGGTMATLQRYVTSSPPFDMGDGEAGGFIFAIVNNSGEIVSHYAADVPPWAYNGPTDIRACRTCKNTKRKFRRVLKPLSFDEIMSGVKPKTVEQEITQAIKNADMGLIPHPFGTVPAGHKVVLLDTQSEAIRNMIDYQNAGGDLNDIVLKGLKVDNQPLKLKSPKGVMTVGFSKR